MTDLDTLYKLVKEILEVDGKSRGNDMWLYVQVCKNKNHAVLKQPFYLVMEKSNEYGLPAFESVSRARRKVQSDHPELKPSEAVQERREEYEQMYFEWAIGGNT